jgi:Tfp pilus assembly protein PilN|tara:strand:+ start:3223 stop:3630 length:408 start_codon:yes stop_codon:yes gene_type:complete
MGLKISLILTALLLATASGSAVYIKYLLGQNAILYANQATLEKEIGEQNESIKKYLSDQAKQNKKISEMEEQRNIALRESQELRNKFARHNLDNLALVKPKLIEKRINSASKKVFEDLIILTNPEQFNEEANSDS